MCCHCDALGFISQGCPNQQQQKNQLFHLPSPLWNLLSSRFLLRTDLIHPEIFVRAAEVNHCRVNSSSIRLSGFDLGAHTVLTIRLTCHPDDVLAPRLVQDGLLARFFHESRNVVASARAKALMAKLQRLSLRPLSRGRFLLCSILLRTDRDL